MARGKEQLPVDIIAGLTAKKIELIRQQTAIKSGITNLRHTMGGSHMADHNTSNPAVPPNLDRITREIFAIDNTVKAIHQGGTYGICADCGKQIPKIRLRANPTAERCVPCQAAIEKLPRR